MKIETRTKYEILEVGDIILEDGNTYLLCTRTLDDSYILVNLEANNIEGCFTTIEEVLGLISSDATIIKAKDVKLIINR